MNNQPFNETQTKEWAKFWQGELGQLYLNRMNNTKQIFINDILNCTDKETLSNLAGRAAGIELIFQDILAGIEAGKEKKEGKKAHK